MPSARLVDQLTEEHNHLVHAVSLRTQGRTRIQNGVGDNLRFRHSDQPQPRTAGTRADLRVHVPNLHVLQTPQAVPPRCLEGDINNAVEGNAPQLIPDEACSNDKPLVGQPPTMP